MVWHQMAIDNEPSHEVPDVPRFAVCVARLRSVKGGSAGEPELKRECQQRYLALLGPALDNLIHAQWLIGETAELGLKVNSAVLAQEVKASTGSAEAASTLKRQGMSIADARRELLLGQLTTLLADRVKEKTPRVDHAEIAKYYQAHKRSFLVPERRDLHIIRTVSEAAAQKALSEVRSGKSFASVLKGLALPQPIKTKEGLLRGLTPKYFSEPVLSEAIFKAPPHVLSGPVKIELGYYIFEVTKITPRHQQSLAEAEATIKANLPAELHEQALAAAVAAFKRKWTARTRCRTGYVVENCLQPKPTNNLEEAYTF
jgi:hypothetical protein